MDYIGKKPLWLLSALALLIACQTNQSKPERPKLLWIGPSTKHTQPLWNIDNSPLCPDLADTQACTRRIETHYITLYPQQCARNGNILTVYLRTGQPLAYEDAKKTGSADTARYNLLAYFPDQQYYLIREASSAAQSITLVDALNGEELQIPHVPFFSPDKARFVAATNHKGQNNRIEIWTIGPPAFEIANQHTETARRLTREWAGESDTWRFSGIEWIDVRSFSLTRKRSAGPTDIVGETMRMAHSSTGWVGNLVGATLHR
ncbi:MAG TPA: hypothetical protein EYQ18_04450 [Candidatus Handelsmanbacteria bacterium]|nr:hypothetical protein [Candidatus Handelsmanbacteria bacterium]